MSDDPTIPSDEEIIALCCSSGPNTNNVLYPSKDEPRLFIKYGPDLLGEARTQMYIFTKARDNRNAPRVPKVYRSFRNNKGRSYIVMEYVKAPTVEESLAQDPTNIHSKVAAAVQWLIDLPVPEDAHLGPIGGGRARHAFFPDHVAPLEYTSIGALDRHINEALRRLPPAGRCSIDLASESLSFYHSDVRKTNFLYSAETGDRWMIDFGEIGVLPRSFASYGLNVFGDELGRPVAAIINLPQPGYSRAMSLAAYILMISGSGCLGLDDDGYWKVRQGKPRRNGSAVATIQ